MKRNKGFTIAELLVVLAIIGVVAALSIPSITTNSKQREFATGLKRAVSNVNAALQLAAADKRSPRNLTGNVDLVTYAQLHVNCTKNSQSTCNTSYLNNAGGTLFSLLSTYMNPAKTIISRDIDNRMANLAFYTNDGIRYEFPILETNQLPLHEDNTINLTSNMQAIVAGKGCGSMGLPYGFYKGEPPCMVVVDVNGDKKPNPRIPAEKNPKEANNVLAHHGYISPDPGSKKLSDVFVIMVTDTSAVPYGVVAQRAIYEVK